MIPDNARHDDTLASIVSGATNAANAFGLWLSNTAKEKAPQLYDKTSKLSADVLVKTKTATSEAFEKTAVFAKKASFVVEQFVEKQLEQHGMITKREEEPQTQTSISGATQPSNADKLPNLAE